MDGDPDDETLRDGVAEAINIITGNAKARLPQQPEQAICLSLPTVIRGTGVSIDYPTNANWIEIPFTSDLGNFSLLVAFLTLSSEGINR
jgi:CheY-specific phosphatase CheX